MMADRAVHKLVPYSGYPQNLRTASGAPLHVVLDATRPLAFARLWGLTLLERNLRTVERLGCRHVHILTRPADQARARRRRFAAMTEADCHAVEGGAGSVLPDLAARIAGPILLLEADALYDRRLLAALWQRPAPSMGATGTDGLEAPALLVDAAWLGDLPPAEGRSLGDLARDVAGLPGVERVDLGAIESRVSLLRKTVPPCVIRVASKEDLGRADAHLKDMAGKGVNDLIGQYLHPPIEFFLTRLAALTPITPNQVSYFIILLSLLGLYDFACGRLWAGVAVNLVRGVVDGIDGKLARLTLRESKYGNLLDHGTDTIYLPLLFLALGWGLSGGDPTSAPAVATYVLQAFYWLNRVLASWFKAFLGVDESEFRPIDRVARRLQPKRNIFIFLMIPCLWLGAPRVGLYAITGLTIAFAVFRLARLDYEARRGEAPHLRAAPSR